MSELSSLIAQMQNLDRTADNIERLLKQVLIELRELRKLKQEEK